MAIAVLFPRYDHPAIEERYASWQADRRLHSQGSRVYYYAEDAPAADAAAEIEEPHVLVITDPMLLTGDDLATSLLAALGDAEAAVPVSNVATNPAQNVALPSLYMTLRELELVIRHMKSRGTEVDRVTWGKDDPSAFLCRTDLLDSIRTPLPHALSGRTVAISRSDYVHRWASMRGQVREDLLVRIPTDAKSVLEFGCGEASLGYAIKQRQQCRVAGIELDPEAAAIAKRRIDVVYQGDANEVIALLHERFDWIIGGDIVEHLADPWSFLGDLRRVATEGGRLLLSLPNLANASIIADLLAGRFDYVYMGLACVGHLRFFTRKSIEDMLAISGWTPVEITPQEIGVTPPGEELMQRLEKSGLPFSREDLTASGFYVIARNG
jgi:SAM-dependent methyltransferase